MMILCLGFFPKCAFAHSTHNTGLFLLFFGIPLTIISLLVSAILLRSRFRDVGLLIYCGMVATIVIVWLPIYGRVTEWLIMDSHEMEKVVSVFMALMPLILASVWRILAYLLNLKFHGFDSEDGE